MPYTPNILIIDDEPRMCDSIQLLLSEKNYNVSTATSWHDASRHLRNNDFDLVLLDLVMPEMDGYQVMSEIQRQYPDILIIILTGHVSIKSAVEALKQGAYDYLRKPFEFEDLLKTIQNALVQKKTGTALKQSESRYKLASDAGQVGVWDWNFNTGEIYVDPSVTTMLGYKGVSIPKNPNNWIMSIHPDDMDRIITEFSAYLEGRVPEFETILRMVHRDGSSLWFLVRCTIIRNKKGNPYRLVGTATNVTKRIETEEALRESEIRFREMAGLLPTIICETDLNMRLRYINKAGIDTFGYSQSEINQGIQIPDLLHDKDAEKVTRSLRKALEGESTEAVECRMLNKKGVELILLINAARIVKNNQPNGLRISFTDFTAQRRLYARLQQALKMEAVASLSGGIAHEFNNALMGINGNVELLQMVLPADHEYSRYIDKIISSTNRMAKLTSQLLAYARGGKYRLKRISIRNIVENTLPSIQCTMDSSVRVETELTEGATIIKADLAQIQMVVSAVVINAYEAIEDSGIIKITAKKETFDDAEVKHYPGHKTGAHALLIVEDNGKGMNKKTRDKVFDPFFTTKFQGRGLAMAAVYGIIKSHKGWIGIESEPGRGTTVSIHLPVDEGCIEKADPADDQMKIPDANLEIDDQTALSDPVNSILLRA